MHSSNFMSLRGYYVVEAIPITILRGGGQRANEASDLRGPVGRQ